MRQGRKGTKKGPIEKQRKPKRKQQPEKDKRRIVGKIGRARRRYSNARRIAIIGVGNPLMADDGVGIAVLELLMGMDIPKGVEIIDAGTGGMALLHTLAKYDAVIIADAVDMGMKPGTVSSFSPDEVVSIKELRRLSLHEGDVFEMILMARRLGQCPSRITICAIQPKSVAPKVGLTAPVKKKIDALAKSIESALKNIQ